MRWGRIGLAVLAALLISAVSISRSYAGDEKSVEKNEASSDEEAAVKETIVDAYVNGIHIDRDIPAIRRVMKAMFARKTSMNSSVACALREPPRFLQVCVKQMIWRTPDNRLKILCPL